MTRRLSASLLHERRNSVRRSPAVSSSWSLRFNARAGGWPRSDPLSVCICVHLWFPSSLSLLLRSAPPHRIGGLVIQRLTHCVHDGLHHLHPPEPFEVRFHHGPWRGERARPQQHIFHGFVVAAPFLAVAPILRRQLPALVRRVLALLEPFQLFFGTDLQPELHHHGACVHKLPLEIVDLPIGPLPRVLRAESLPALHQHAAVPRKRACSIASACRPSGTTTTTTAISISTAGIT